MAEMGYIKKEDALAAIRSVPDGNWSRERYISEIVSAPAADVEPVRHGKWIKLDMHHGMEQYKCSECNVACYVPVIMGEPMYEGCPICRAKMDGGADNG